MVTSLGGLLRRAPALLLVLAAQASAQADPTAAGLAHRVPGMDSVVVQRDLVYKRQAPYRRLAPDASAPRARDLALDVYRPPGAGGGLRAAVLFAHGGVRPSRAPLPKDWRVYRDWGRLAAASGLVGIAFNHRATTDGNVDEAAADVRDAVDYVRTHAGELGVDPDRLCVVFFSAGGPAAGPLLRDPPPALRCVGFFYAYLDVEHVRPAAWRDSLAAHSPRAALAVCPRRMPELFIAIGARDGVPGLNASVTRFVAAALEVGVSLELHVHGTGGHGFDVGTGDQRAAGIVARAIAFFRRALDADAPRERGEAGREPPCR
jgi:acetyl esterase/lipase